MARVIPIAQNGPVIDRPKPKAVAKPHIAAPHAKTGIDVKQPVEGFQPPWLSKNQLMPPVLDLISLEPGSRGKVIQVRLSHSGKSQTDEAPARAVRTGARGHNLVCASNPARYQTVPIAETLAARECKSQFSSYHPNVPGANFISPPRRFRNREHLTPAEIDRLLKGARTNRWACRDRTLVLISYGHGLRVSEALGAIWEDFDLEHGVFHVRRRKGSISGDHPLRGVEIRALRQLRREGPTGDHVFCSERGGKLTARGARKIIERLGVRSGLGKLNVHPHMFRHSCGYKLIDQGTDLRTVQAYLGHANIRHTVKYTHLNPSKFKRLWDD